MASSDAARVLTVDSYGAQPPLGVETGSAFGWQDRMFIGYGDDGVVFDYGDWEARDISEMMTRDYKAKQIENVLALPIMSAERHIVGIKGDSGELDWLQGFWDADPIDGGCRTSLNRIIGSNTTAITYKKNFNELVFRQGYQGKITYDKVAYRPQTTCRAMRDPLHGDLIGFEQEPYAASSVLTAGVYPIKIPIKRAYIYVHGQRLDPLGGTSDLQVAHWCYKTKQKLLFLWFQFLESVALPRTVVKAQDVEVARQIAAQIARMKGSAILPVGTSGNANSVEISTLDSSGKGADQFHAAITWLDQAATNSVLAGFLDLTGAAANGLRGGGGGSYALSKDASDYFLQFEEAKTHEIEDSIRNDLFAPLIRYNFGSKGKVPKLQFEPLNAEDKSAQLAMLNTVMAAKGPTAIPDEFTGMLAQQVGAYMGMDATKLNDLFVQAGKATAAQAAATSAAGAAPIGQNAATAAGVTQAASAVLPTGPRKPLPPELANLPWDQLH